MTSRALSRIPLWLVLWGTLVGVAIFIRPALPIDETRYLAVAWEMWWKHSVAVPYLNHAYYDGKPPLLFWLMHLGWLATGVNEWWPRLVAPLAGLANLLLVAAIARRLWPGTRAHALAPLVLVGSSLWAVFCASTMFDTLLGVFALGAVYWIVRAAQEGRRTHFVWAGVSLGFGILAKGPVVFLPALWIVVPARWWMCGAWRERWPACRWFAAALAAPAVAAVIAASWVVPMALSSDAAYVQDMLFHQTAGYVAESFAHRRPFWWYVPLVPLILFPWTAWPGAWRALGALRDWPDDAGLRLCTIWALGVFLTFSAISAKQAHYLLLVFPAVALLLARLLGDASFRVRAPAPSLALPGLALALLALGGIVLASGRLTLPGLAWSHTPPGVVAYAAPAALLAIAWAVALKRPRSIDSAVARLSSAVCAAVLLLTWAAMTMSAGAYDPRPASAYVAKLAATGEPVAFTGRYDGQFNFYGRITRRIEAIAPGEASGWARAHRTGYVVAVYGPGDWPPPALATPQFQALYRSGGVAVWAARDIASEPRIARSLR